MQHNTARNFINTNSPFHVKEFIRPIIERDVTTGVGSAAILCPFTVQVYGDGISFLLSVTPILQALLFLYKIQWNNYYWTVKSACADLFAIEDTRVWKFYYRKQWRTKLLVSNLYLWSDVKVI